MDEKYIRRMMSTMKCSVCGERYESGNISVLGHRDDVWFLSVFCPSCHSQGLVAAVINDSKVPQVVTDLTQGEKAKFGTGNGVEADDILDIHDFLKGFDGDFSKLFAR
jgi:hypothetical protein